MADNTTTPTTNIDKLASLLGFSPTKEVPGAAAFKGALEEIQKERDAKLQAKVKEQLGTALDLAQKMAKLDREYLTQRGKWDKELGKLINGLTAAAGGKEPPAPVEEKEEATQTA